LCGGERDGSLWEIKRKIYNNNEHFDMLDFEEKGKPGEPLGAKTRTKNKTYIIMKPSTGFETQAILAEGECSHHCAIPTPRN